MAGVRTRRLGSVAGRLLVVTMLIVVVIIAAVSGYLLQRRLAEDRQLASGNAESRAILARNLLDDIVRPQARSVAEQLSAFSSLDAALTGTRPQAAVADLFSSGRIPVSAGLGITVIDAGGAVVYSTLATSPAAASLPSVKLATAVGRDAACHRSRRALDSDVTLAARCPASLGGVEQLTASTASLDVAAPVLTGAGFQFSGLVLVSATLADDFFRYGSVVGYPVVYVPSGAADGATRYPNNLDPTQAAPQAPQSAAALPAAMTAALPRQPDAGPTDAEYGVSGIGVVESSYTPILGPGRDTVAGWLGAEVPRPPVPWQDIRVIVGLGVTAIVVVFFVMLWFVLRFVRQPIARLERGVARIAGGDYATGIAIDSDDEIGSLARSVNRMREQIQSYVADLDLSISQLQNVSRALTTTTTGVGALQAAITGAAQVIAGDGASASLLHGQDGHLVAMEATTGDGAAAAPLEEDVEKRVLGGETVAVGAAAAWRTVVPMFAQDQVLGAISLLTPAPLSDSDRRAVEALANNGGIALENTRLFEQERATVARLRELDSMKSDFLSTAQHELRTPVLAIMGQLELIRLAWTTWDDATKLEVIQDVDASTRMLSDLVETIIDFSLLSTETIKLKIAAVAVRPAVEAAVEDVRRHFKETLPVNVHVDISGDCTVTADAKRFRQVVRSLIDNAVKFTEPDGHIGVRAVADGDGVRIEVLDNGTGISPAALPKVFDRFFQEDNSRTRQHGGMGMGLALVKRLCEAQGATVQITSTPGQGTTVSMHWPGAAAASVDETADSFHLSQI